MSAMPTTIHWIVLYPVLAVFIATTTVLTGVVRSTGGGRRSILVPISGVLLLAGTALVLAQTGSFCAFCL